MNATRYKLAKTMSDEYLLLDTKVEIQVQDPRLFVAERIKHNYFGVFEISNINLIDSDSQFAIIASTAKYNKNIPLLRNSKEQLKLLFKEEECFCEIEEEDLALDLFEKPNKKEGWFPIATEGEAVLYSRPLIVDNLIKVKEFCV